MDRREVIELVLQFLNENGFLKAQGALQEESGVILDTDVLEGGGILHSVLNIYGKSRHAAKKKPEIDTSDLNEKATEPPPSTLVHTVNNLHTAPILAARLKDDIMLTGSADKTIAVIKFTDFNDFSWYRENTLDHHSGAVLCIDFHPTLENIALTSSMDKSHHIVDFMDGQVIQSFSDHEKYVVRVKWSPDGLWFATASYDRTANLYKKKPDSDPIQFEKVKTFHFRGAVEALEFSPDNDELCIAVRDDCLLYFIDLKSPEYEPITMNMNALKDTYVSFTALDVSYSPFGKKYVLVCTDKNRLILFARETGDQVKNFYGLNNDEFSTPRHCWHPSGRYIFATSQDKCIYIWEVLSQKIVGKLVGHEGNVRDLSFDAKHGLLISSGFDRTVNFWK